MNRINRNLPKLTETAGSNSRLFEPKLTERVYKPIRFRFVNCFGSVRFGFGENGQGWASWDGGHD
jgi:hypothetical protein